jgi:hypothetical protein
MRLVAIYPFLLAVVLASTPCLVFSQNEAPRSLSTGPVMVVGESEAFGTLIAAKVGVNGNVYALDQMNARLTAFSPDGHVLWRAGRAGRGPGEFQLAYRLDVAPNGDIVVYDFGTSELTTFSSAGRFVKRSRLPFSFRQLDNLVVLANGEVLISGFTAANERASRYGIHRFRPRGTDMEYVSSFAPLPAARDREVLAHWGAGNIVRGRNDDILYLLRLPYEIHRYNATGRERATVRPPTPVRGVPDDFVKIERTPQGTRISSAAPNVDRPGSILEYPRNGKGLSVTTPPETCCG